MELSTDNMLTGKDICRIYDITWRTLYNWRDRGLPYVKMGKAVFYERNEAVRWIRLHGKRLTNPRYIVRSE